MRTLRIAAIATFVAVGLGTAALAESRGDNAPAALPGRGYDAAAHYEQAVAALKAGDYAAAARAARKVLIVAPRSAEAWRALGLAKAGAGEWNAALDAYRTALAFAPNDGISRAGAKLARAKLETSAS